MVTPDIHLTAIKCERRLWKARPLYIGMRQCDNLEKNIRAAQCCNYKNGRIKHAFFQQCIEYSERGAAHTAKRVSRKLLVQLVQTAVYLETSSRPVTNTVCG